MMIHIFYCETTDKYSVSFWESGSEHQTLLSVTANLSQEEFSNLKFQISQAENKKQENDVPERMLQAYMDCALWVSVDDNFVPLDKNYGISNIAQETKYRMRQDLIDFLSLLKKEGITWQDHITAGNFGHDFWLTRNGHGSGFWDRLNDELGEDLTKWAHTFGSCDLYVGNDNLIYME